MCGISLPQPCSVKTRQDASKFAVGAVQGCGSLTPSSLQPQGWLFLKDNDFGVSAGGGMLFASFYFAGWACIDPLLQHQVVLKRKVLSGKRYSPRLVSSMGKGKILRYELEQGIPYKRPCWSALPAGFHLHSNDEVRHVKGQSPPPLVSSNCSNWAKKKSFSVSKAYCVTGGSRRFTSSSKVMS